MDGDSFEVLAPAGTPVSVGERVVYVQPLRIRQFPAVVRALRPALAALVKAGSPEGGIDEVALLDVYLEHAEAVNKAVAIMSGVQTAEFEELEIGQGLAIFAACLGVNRDFFTRTLPNLFAQAAGAIPAGPGPTT